MARVTVFSVVFLVVAVHVAARPLRTSDSAMAPVIDENVGPASAPEVALNENKAFGLAEEKQIIPMGGAGMGGLAGIGGFAGMAGGILPSSSLGGLGGLGGGVGTLGGIGAGMGAGMGGVAGMGGLPLSGGLPFPGGLRGLPGNPLGGSLGGLPIPSGLPIPGDFGNGGNSGPLPVP